MLLATTLGRLLRSRGWAVEDLQPDREPSRPVNAVIVTPERSREPAVIDLTEGVGAPLKLVLTDGGGDGFEQLDRLLAAIEDTGFT